jgi:hypothetical protein
MQKMKYSIHSDNGSIIPDSPIFYNGSILQDTPYILVYNNKVIDTEHVNVSRIVLKGSNGKTSQYVPYEHDNEDFIVLDLLELFMLADEDIPLIFVDETVYRPVQKTPGLFMLRKVGTLELVPISRCLQCALPAKFQEETDPLRTFCSELCQLKIGDIDDKNLIGLMGNDGTSITLTLEEAKEFDTIEKLLEDARDHDDYIPVDLHGRILQIIKRMLHNENYARNLVNDAEYFDILEACRYLGTKRLHKYLVDMLPQKLRSIKDQGQYVRMCVRLKDYLGYNSSSLLSRREGLPKSVVLICMYELPFTTHLWNMPEYAELDDNRYWKLHRREVQDVLIDSIQSGIPDHLERWIGHVEALDDLANTTFDIDQVEHLLQFRQIDLPGYVAAYDNMDRVFSGLSNWVRRNVRQDAVKRWLPLLPEPMRLRILEIAVRQGNDAAVELILDLQTIGLADLERFENMASINGFKDMARTLRAARRSRRGIERKLV